MTGRTVPPKPKKQYWNEPRLGLWERVYLLEIVKLMNPRIRKREREQGELGTEQPERRTA